MRQLTIPEELALPYLLQIDESKLAIRSYFDEGYQCLCQGRFEGAIKIADQIVAAAGSDRSLASHGKLLRADALRRAGRLLESIDAVRDARRWLRQQVDFRSRYNDAIAMYLKGCLSYMLRSEEDVLRAFTYAQQELAGLEKTWWIEKVYYRSEDCRKVRNWMKQLLELQKKLGPEMTFTLPVYEFLDQRTRRVGVIAICPFETEIPATSIARYCIPYGHFPLLEQTISFFSLNPEITYVAVRICGGEDAKLYAQAEKEDLIVLQATNPVALMSGVELTPDQPFVRLGDGTIEFRPVMDDKDSFKGKARLLIKREFLKREDGVYELRRAPGTGDGGGGPGYEGAAPDRGD